VEEEDDESEFLFTPRPDIRAEQRTGPLSAAETGSAHHAFLEQVALGETGSAARLREEAVRLRREGGLSPAQAACLDFKALAAFWQSGVGRQLLGQRENVRRELAFTARFSPMELEALQRLADQVEKPTPQSSMVGRAVPCPPCDSNVMLIPLPTPDGGKRQGETLSSRDFFPRNRVSPRRSLALPPMSDALPKSVQSQGGSFMMPA
jgi:hypothetical protein